MPKTKGSKKCRPGPGPRTPTTQERQLEALAVERFRAIGRSMGYSRLSQRVTVIFQQYRYSVTNMERRRRVYRALSGLLTHGLHRAPAGTVYVYSQEILQIVRDTYPIGVMYSGACPPTNLNHRGPTLEVGVDDLFDDKH